MVSHFGLTGDGTYGRSVSRPATDVYGSVARHLFFGRRQAEIARRSRLYVAQPDRESIERYQLAALNRIWSYCLRDVPFYRSWAAEHALPAQLGSLSELREFPALTKQVILDRQDEVFQGGTLVDAYSSGGTTGAPTRYPKGRGDSVAMYADTYTARGWWGLRPFDSYVHLWGHSHVFGGSEVARVKRAFADKAVNALRLSAYDLGEEAMDRHFAALVRRDPVYVMGYTSAVFRLARYIESHGLHARLPRLKAVIVTSETVSEADVTLIGRVFGVPVVIEYGSAETMTLATSRGSSWPLQVLWTGCIMRVDDDHDVHVTTINDRLFPLVNYAIGDQVEAADIDGQNALTLTRVLGRQQDVMQVREQDGRVLELSLILPVHILKLQAGITGVQFRQEPDQLVIFLIATEPLDLPSVARDFARQIKRDHPRFDERSVTFRQVAEPTLTRAGKHAFFI